MAPTVPGALAAPATPRWVAALDMLLKLSGGALVVVMLGTVMAGVVSRALNQPLSWTDEASGFLMVWLACLGWMIATRQQAHIRIRVFQDLLPAAPWRVTEGAIQAAMLVLGATIAWFSIHLVRTNADIEALALPISTAWMYAPMLPAGLMTLAHAAVELWLQFTRHGGPVTESPVQEAASL
jgi:TRAP-type transport system small permease protein